MTEVFDKVFGNSVVVDFGKVIFVQKNHTVPSLPDMNLIMLKDNNTYQAICIDVEIDATGDTFKEACINLKGALLAYIGQIVANYNGNIKVAVEEIVNTAFSTGTMKSSLFERYKDAKRQYILKKIAKENKAKLSRTAEFLNAWKRLFQFQPIRIDLTLSAEAA